MDYRSIDQIPVSIRRNSRPTNNAVRTIVQEIYDIGIEVAEIFIEEGEYSSIISARSSLSKAIQSLDLPMRAVIKFGHLYIERI